MFLSIDQGGHASRAILYARNGDIIAEAARPVATTRAQGLHVEQDAQEILLSVREAIAEVTDNGAVPAAQISAAGLATQRSSLVCMDRITGEALTPVISWQDRRAAPWLEGFADSAAQVKRRTGLPLSPHYGVSKIAWCLDNVPEVQAAADRSRLVAAPLASFLLYELLNEQPWLVDPANASRTLLMNATTLAWDPWLLELFGIPARVLPVLAPTSHAYGQLEDTAIPVRVVNGDQAAAVFAWGEPATGTAFINMGTGAFIQAVAGSEPLADPDLLSSIAWTDAEQRVYVLEGTVNGAGSAVEQVRKQIGMTEEQLLGNAADWLATLAPDVLFMNGVGGLGSPDWVADFASGFVGNGGQQEKIVATYESIVFLIVRNLERMQAQLAVSDIVVSGGLAQLDSLCQRLASLSRLPVSRPDNQEATALGIAQLLGVDRSGTTPATCFAPRDDVGLQGRYHRWTRELKLRLAGGSPTGDEKLKR